MTTAPAPTPPARRPAPQRAGRGRRGLHPLRQALAAALLAAVALAGPAAQAAAPTHVYIESGTVGQGMLFRWRDGCFALTANHVLGSSDRALLVAGSNAQVRGSGLLLARFGDDDLALLRVGGALSQPQHCDTTLDELRSDSEALNRGEGTGTLAYVDREGQLLRIDIVFKTPRQDLLLIEPRQAGDQLFRGRSGSLVLRAERAAGILVRLHEGDGRLGVLVSMGQAVARLERWFARPAASTTATTPAPLAGEQGNLLDARLGAEALNWSTLPATPDTGPERLLQADAAQPWVARSDPRGRPVEVDFKLVSGAEAATLARIEIDVPLSQPPARWASELEILFSLSGEPGSWKPFGATVLLHQDEARKVLESAPVRARYLKLRVYKNRGDPSLLSLARLRAYASRRAANGP